MVPASSRQLTGAAQEVKSPTLANWWAKQSSLTTVTLFAPTLAAGDGTFVLRFYFILFFYKQYRLLPLCKEQKDAQKDVGWRKMLNELPTSWRGESGTRRQSVTIMNTAGELHG